MDVNRDRGTFRETVIMSSQRKYLLIAAPLLATVVVWSGCSRSKHTQEPNEPRSHAEIAGPAAIKANADQLPRTIVTPHLECEIPADKNVLWCATFQVAWNELCDLARSPVQWHDAPEMVHILNKRTVTRQDLNEDSYIALAGWTTSDANDIRQKITRELNGKFRDAANPELLSRLNSVPPRLAISYAYLFRELPFEWEFDRMRGYLRFDGRVVESFGIQDFGPNNRNQAQKASQVLIYDYRSNDDFIIELKTRSTSDRLILAKTPPGRTLTETATAVQKRLRQSEPSSMEALSDLFIPVIDFDVLRDYTELTGRDSILDVALQQTRFKLTEKGAVLKSEAAIASRAASFKNLIFDKPFLVMIQRTDASQSYFALWIANTELLVPFHETVSKTSSSVK
jgi:hypothetical protein